MNASQNRQNRRLQRVLCTHTGLSVKVNVSLFLVKYYNSMQMQCQWRYSFTYTPALDEGEWSDPGPGRLTQGKVRPVPIR
jgi:hypothetical protein